ncbi:hypothetical protein ABZX62_34235 [Streptomyces flavidovirens]|uniref:hypothetical protein n=1 Tax=Streptomyces flavidovirens TaxID=67298 RepID=UPI0033BCDC63
MDNTVVLLGTVPVTARASVGTKDLLVQLRPVLRAERDRARALAQQEPWSTDGLSRREAAARRTRWEEHKAQLRRQGALFDSLDALVAGGLYQELESRGWNRQWPALPRQARGRLPGSPQGQWPEKIAIRLPADLVHTARSACWHACSKEINLLYDWRDRHPKALPTRASRSRCDAEALAEYKQLASKVITTGQIWRAAIHRGVTSAKAI